MQRTKLITNSLNSLSDVGAGNAATSPSKFGHNLGQFGKIWIKFGQIWKIG